MPQASNKILNEFHAHFGKDASDKEAIEYLTKQGIGISGSGLIIVSDEELENERTAAACRYLAEEWDYSY